MAGVLTRFQVLNQKLECHNGNGQVEKNVQPIFTGMVQLVESHVSAACNYDNEGYLDDDFGDHDNASSISFY